MSEPKSNIMFRCAHHKKKSLGLTDKPETFIGKYVKKIFIVENIPGVETESMWVLVKRVEKGRLVGKLDNDPIFVDYLKRGDIVRLSVDEICEVLADA